MRVVKFRSCHQAGGSGFDKLQQVRKDAAAGKCFPNSGKHLVSALPGARVGARHNTGVLKAVGIPLSVL